MVLVFALEYYSSIIFLTTNSIEAVDQAIINRAMLMVNYQPLVKDQKLQIVESCIEKLRESLQLDAGVESYIKDQVYEDRSENPYPWDGHIIVQGTLSSKYLLGIRYM